MSKKKALLAFAATSLLAFGSLSPVLAEDPPPPPPSDGATDVPADPDSSATDPGDAAPDAGTDAPDQGSGDAPPDDGGGQK